jgi:hypothetical protein
VALGYQLDAPTMGSTNLKNSFGSARLADMLSPQAQHLVAQAGVPDLSLRVLRLQGHLVPGLSGAPIIDQRGGVVAVSDGGLESGAVAISWALPVSNLEQLVVSGEAANQVVAITSTHFAADIDVTPQGTLTCGGMSFTKLRTRTYEELRRTTDDPEGLQRVQQIAELADVDLPSLTFDIYVNLNTGATVVLPQGVNMSQSGTSCVASAFSGNPSVHIRGAWPTNPLHAAQQFLDETMIPTGLGWAPSPLFSYTAPHVRFDNFEVNRAEYLGIHRDDPGLLFGSGTPVAAAFEIIMKRGNAFVGMMIFNYNPNTWTPATVMQCELTPYASGCRGLKQEIQTWVAMLVGGFLSTFPIG